MSITKPRFDGFEGLKETINWVTDHDDIQERASRLKEACDSSAGFTAFMNFLFVDKLSFVETMGDKDAVYHWVKHDRFTAQPVARTCVELARYADGSSMQPSMRYNQLMSVLDWTWPEDAEIIAAFVKGEYEPPLKLNLKVLHIAYPQLGE